jgi:hypothetical protein
MGCDGACDGTGGCCTRGRAAGMINCAQEKSTIQDAYDSRGDRMATAQLWIIGPHCQRTTAQKLEVGTAGLCGWERHSTALSDTLLARQGDRIGSSTELEAICLQNPGTG